MAEEQTAVQKMLGDFAPELVRLTDDVLFGEVWAGEGLSQRDRSLITVSVLIALYRADQLAFHLPKALENGVTKDELVEAITHIAFYAGWPNAMSAISQLKSIVESETDTR
ncbi:carboxymuconolactone decarboxylase family protein [Streptomyces pseudogriseolus]|uniref:carboxymuconolactone decarboxylase family protein n=1 Tax=Streptomyces pseudogriseolus TaxID=36817 RepID=UPI0034756132